MKAIPFAIVLVLGLAAILSAFDRGSRVPVPPELRRRPVVFNARGLDLELDGLRVGQPFQPELTGRTIEVSPDDEHLITGVQGEKLTQGSRLLLRVGHPLQRYTEAFPDAPQPGMVFRPQPGILLLVEADGPRVSRITLRLEPRY